MAGLCLEQHLKVLPIGGNLLNSRWQPVLHFYSSRSGNGGQVVTGHGDDRQTIEVRGGTSSVEVADGNAHRNDGPEVRGMTGAGNLRRHWQLFGRVNSHVASQPHHRLPPRNAVSFNPPKRQTGNFPRSRANVGIDVRRHTPRQFAMLILSGHQHGTRDQHPLDTSLGETDQGGEW